MNNESRHSVSVAAVVTDDRGLVLVIQRRDNGHWQIPGGVLELDESIHAGLRREVEEETGVLIDPGSLTGVYKNIRLGVVALVFTAQVVGGRTHPTPESAQVDWWTDEQVQLGMTEVFAVRVRDALAPSPNVRIRTHDGFSLLD
jgi:8-oxo-dGTP diphosphatase